MPEARRNRSVLFQRGTNRRKYRVYLEWVDEKGWKPVKMDILNTLDFEY